MRRLRMVFSAKTHRIFHIGCSNPHSYRLINTRNRLPSRSSTNLIAGICLQRPQNSISEAAIRENFYCIRGEEASDLFSLLFLWKVLAKRWASSRIAMHFKSTGLPELRGRTFFLPRACPK